jgi:hypothetical protein
VILLLKDCAKEAQGKERWWFKTTQKINLKIKQTAARRKNPRTADFPRNLRRLTARAGQFK